jgi:hypothetical protein
MKKYKLNLLFLALLTGLMSCSKDEETSKNIPNPDGLIPVSVRADINFGQNASTRMNEPAPKVVTEIGKKDKSILRTRLTPTEAPQTRASMANKRYRVYFFDNNGGENQDKCAGYKEIIGGQENSDDNKISLLAGDYTVIGISFNSSEELDGILPEITSNPLGKPIANFSFTVSPTDGDLLFKQTNVTISSSAQTVSLTFNHMFNQVSLSGSYIILPSDATQAFYMDGGTTVFATNSTTATTTPTAIPGLTGTIPSYSGTLSFSSGSLSNAVLQESPITISSTSSSTPVYVYLPNSSFDVTITGVDDSSVSSLSALVDKTITFTGTAVQNTNYSLTFSWSTNGSTTNPVVPLYWAKGNLICNANTTPATSTYSIFPNYLPENTYDAWNTAKSQSYFKWDWPLPYGSYGSSASNTGDYDDDSSNDPCFWYVDSSHPSWTWRLPRGYQDPKGSEFKPLVALRTAGNYIKVGNFAQNNSSPSGYWLGNSLSTSDDASKIDRSEFLYLPAAGYSSNSSYVGSYGAYWSSTPNGTGGAYNLYLSSGSLGEDSGSNRNYGFSVRCFSDGE